MTTLTNFFICMATMTYIFENPQFISTVVHAIANALS